MAYEKEVDGDELELVVTCELGGVKLAAVGPLVAAVERLLLRQGE